MRRVWRFSLQTSAGPLKGLLRDSALSHFKGAIRGGKSHSLAFGTNEVCAEIRLMPVKIALLLQNNFKAECIRFFEEKERIISLS